MCIAEIARMAYYCSLSETHVSLTTAIPQNIQRVLEIQKNTICIIAVLGFLKSYWQALKDHKTLTVPIYLRKVLVFQKKGSNKNERHTSVQQKDCKQLCPPSTQTIHFQDEQLT